MDLVVYDDEERRYVPWLVSVAAVVLTGVLAAGITFLITRSPQPESLGGRTAPQAATTADPSPTAPDDGAPSPSATPRATSTPSPKATSPDVSAACRTALARADALVARSTALDEALAAHTRIMDELLAERLTTDQALDQTLPVLTRGATARDRFEDELAAYQASRGTCSD